MDDGFAPFLVGMRVLLIVPSEARPEILADRLRMQGHDVEVAAGPADGAHLALSAPPDVLVADLWMPKISGVQLCLLLRSEVATEHVPVILRGPDGPRHRFWAEHAGAVDYVVRGRTVDLVRALDRASANLRPAESFFTQLDDAADIRDRIAAHLDTALYASAIANEIRALASSRSFARLFDRLTQLLSRLTSYRWLALTTDSTLRLALHATPGAREAAERQARTAMACAPGSELLAIEDDDPKDELDGPAPMVLPIELDGERLGMVALAPASGAEPFDREHFAIVARELASPLRMTSLLEATERLATTDPLTGAMNRRAFSSSMDVEMGRSMRFGYSIALLLVDVDHFKRINDTYGHGVGDLVLQGISRALKNGVRNVDVVARWGGEEFVIALCGSTYEGAFVAAERLRTKIESGVLSSESDLKINVTVSIGVSMLASNMGVAIERADRALYVAKDTGRNRVIAFSDDRAVSANGEVVANLGGAPAE